MLAGPGPFPRPPQSPNLLVDASWRTKVCDFNLSKLWTDASAGASASSLAGMNPRWLAPEILAGGRATASSDVFSFGIILWELLSWDIPWASSNVFLVPGLVTAGRRLALPPRDALPGPASADWPGLGAYIALMERCWAQEPGARPSMAEVAAVLK